MAMSSAWSNVTIADLERVISEMPDHRQYPHTPLNVCEARLYAEKFGISPLSKIEGVMLSGAPIRVIFPMDCDGNLEYPPDWEGDD